MLNVYIILHTDKVLDVILNSLAFEFIGRIDEDIAKTLWWDPEQRWITAGAIGIVLQSTVRLNWLKAPDEFSKWFSVCPEELKRLCNEDPHLLKNDSVAQQDASDLRFMTNDEAVKFRCRVIAREMRNANAMGEYEEPSLLFGFVDRIINRMCGRPHRRIFNRFWSYRTWSRWDALLYKPPVPNLDDIFEVDAEGNSRISDNLGEIKPSHNAPFSNFYPNHRNLSDERIFVHHVLDVLCLKYMISGLRSAWNQGKRKSFFFHALDGLVQCAAYLVTLLFPFFMMIAIIGMVDAVASGYYRTAT